MPGVQATGNPVQRAVRPFVCPSCHGPLTGPHSEPSAADGAGALTNFYCPQCAHAYHGVGGSYDFVNARSDDEAHERDHYEHVYEHKATATPGTPYDVAAWERRWRDPHWPECQILLRRLGDLTGKTVLCLGNGSSAKELFFAHLGADLIHSDLSFQGILKAKAAYDLGDLASRVSFHAINAYQIPLPDGSVDVVYGFEFVHHLPDVPAFLQEVFRVLKPGGQCLFLDGAYSPLWQGLKKSLLWPVMKLSHTLYKRSPEDIRATYAGGYREEDMARLADEHGFTRSLFDRTTFFHYMFVHGVGDILGWNLPRPFYKVPGAIGRCLDWLLTKRIGLLARSRMELIWGFEKGRR